MSGAFPLSLMPGLGVLAWLHDALFLDGMATALLYLDTDAGLHGCYRMRFSNTLEWCEVQRAGDTHGAC